MKKKILLTAYSLGLGGIEKALIHLLHQIDLKKYDVTLILEKKEGVFLDEVPRGIKVEEYRINKEGFVLVRKLKNRLKLWKWYHKHKGKYDFAASFATYSIPGSLLALKASNHNALWIHNNYDALYEHDLNKIKTFFDSVKAEQFQYHVYVSEDNRKAILQYFKEWEEKSFVCNNIVDDQKIRMLAKETVAEPKPAIPLFVSIGRLEEHQKRITRIIEAAKRLVAEQKSFLIYIIGSGPDEAYYQQLVQEEHLEKVIHFLGQKKNPYPYFQMADAILLASEYEGYPVVFIEAMTLNRPLITTKVSDYQTVDKQYGIVVEKSVEGMYQGMKTFLEQGFVIETPFSPQAFNRQIAHFLECLIEDTLTTNRGGTI